MAKSNQKKPDADKEEELKNQLLETISQSPLRPREKEILRLRFGIEDGQPLTIEEVALHLNLTAQTIKRVETKALRKLRHPNGDSRLKEYLI